MYFLLLMSLLAPTSFAEQTPSFIAVGTAKTKKTAIYFGEIKVEGASAQTAQSIRNTVINDLLFMDLFRVLQSSEEGADITLKGQVTLSNGSLAFTATATEAAKPATPGAPATPPKELINKKYLSQPSDWKTLAHTFANQLVESLTGMPGIFLTKIAMICDRTGKKEVYHMNFDGTDARNLTKHQSLTVGPAWSPDGTKLAYTLYAKHKDGTRNPDLYEYDFATNALQLLSNRRGMNSGAAYSPDGKKIALTMRFLNTGNAELFTYNPADKSVEKLTQSLGNSVNPTWSPDGKKIAFISDRSGVPMVYVMNADGSAPQRLTYAGKYNDSPSWSPQNNKIAFAGWIDKGFDIFLMNPDGTHIERLTKDQGSNEGPHFSPDGGFVVFQSNRTGQDNIYVMNVDGTFVKRLTYGLGNCTSPKWSNPPGGLRTIVK